MKEKPTPTSPSVQSIGRCRVSTLLTDSCEYQLSQEKILKIMNMVKNKEVSIEGALHLAQKEVYADKDSQDLLTGSQFNFIIYKYKHYRWQKRILQIDFNARTIFNIEKGIIKKQFPFSQVKACEDTERRRFSIVFHGRQDYELEAVSLDDKRKIIYLLSRVILSNSYKRPVESCPERPAGCDVIHEGLLDLQQNTFASTEWVKFRIPFTVQNNRPEDVSKLQSEWVNLLEKYCQLCQAVSLSQEGSEGCTSSEADYEEFIAPLNEEKEESFQFGIQKSVWASCDPYKRKIDASRLCEQFQIQDTAVFSGNEPSVNQHIMLDPKVAHNFNIFLKSFRIKPSELKDKLYIIHEESGGLTDEQITALRRYMPTQKDTERYQSFKGSCSELHVVDQFMLEMCKIPHLGQRLDLLLTLRELPVSMRDLEPLINQKIQASKQLQSSLKFVAVLEYILAIGNHLNEKAGKGMTKGFRLSSLAKLPLLRGKERTFTLLHALVEQILLHEPDLATFPQELTEFEAVPDASMKGLSAEVDVLRKELENIIQCRRLIKPKTTKATPQESQFCRELKDLIQKYEGDLAQLSKRCDEMKKLYSSILVKFGEPQDLDSQELFGWISSFISEFRKVCAEIMQKENTNLVK
ncbi:PREDICTED: protein diaphanous homolog 3-like, partial [Acanthisitta chloris]|uniref:protein diaphanous homolog 3-like n=1 Tax=Acanthisitta chloris TaxID=57068 RepID=UPI0004F0D445